MRSLAGGAAAIGFIALAAFQLALALGAPLGRAAWGGAHETLPTSLRIGSAVTVCVYVIAALIVLRRVNLGISQISKAVAKWGTWILAALLPVSALANFASASNWERFLWGPIAAFLALLCLWVAREGEAESLAKAD